MSRHRRRYTSNELDQMVQMRAKGVPWAEIGTAFGTTGAAARQAEKYRRQGKRHGLEDRYRPIREAVIARAEAGEVCATTIARSVGLNVDHCHVILWRAGLDREMRDENAALLRRKNTVDSLSAM